MHTDEITPPKDKLNQESLINVICQGNDLLFLTQTLFLYCLRQEHMSRSCSDDANGSVMDTSAFQSHLSFTDTSLTLQ